MMFVDVHRIEVPPCPDEDNKNGLKKLLNKLFVKVTLIHS